MFKRRKERALHNDRDYACRYWWGDRSGYDLRAERCRVCNPASSPEPCRRYDFDSDPEVWGHRRET